MEHPIKNKELQTINNICTSLYSHYTVNAVLLCQVELPDSRAPITAGLTDRLIELLV